MGVEELKYRGNYIFVCGSAAAAAAAAAVQSCWWTHMSELGTRTKKNKALYSYIYTINKWLLLVEREKKKEN
jgi:hypothetical protein